jgi:uncharacterized protein
VRVVLDTNVLVSGLMYPASVPGKVVGAWRDARVDLVSSISQLEEVGRVLAYPKIRRILKWDDEAIGRFLRQLYLRAEVLELRPFDDPELRDRSDAHILTCLTQSKADLLVSGDADLAALKDRFPIVSPAEFAQRL